MPLHPLSTHAVAARGCAPSFFFMDDAAGPCHADEPPIVTAVEVDIDYNAGEDNV